jgi:DNA-binding GntR family transcriptional regulator
VSATFQKPPTAQEAVLAELRRFIVTGRLRPGEQFVQDALAAELGVSRVPLREALKILEGEGQVTYVAHRGYFVTQLSLSDLLEVYRIREILEAEAVRVGLPQMTTEDVDRLEEAEREVQIAGAAADVVKMTQANRRFHFALIEACGLPRLVRIIGLLWDGTEVYRSVYFTEADNRELVEAEHRDLVAAVKAGDLERTLHVLERHRQHAIAALRPVLEAVAPGQDGGPQGGTAGPMPDEVDFR